MEGDALMLRRKILIYSVALGLSLVASYLTWTKPAEVTTADEEKDAVIVIQGEPDGLRAIAWKSDSREVKLDIRNDERGRYVWVESTERKTKVKKPEPKPPEPANDESGGDTQGGGTGADTGAETGADTAGPEGKAPSPKKPPPVEHESVMESRSFKGGKSVEDMVDRFGPLRARTSFSGVAERLGDFGLDEPKATLVVEREGREARTFIAGDDLYGGKAVYLYDESQDVVYLVDVGAVRGMRLGRSLEDTSLVDLDEKQVVSAVIQTKQGPLELVQENRADRKAFFWSTKGSGERNESAMAWMDKLFRLRTGGYVQPGEEPAGVAPQLELNLVGEDGKTLSITFFEGTDDEGEETWFAQSSHTRGMVEVPAAGASELVLDVGALGTTAAPSEEG